MNGKDLIKVLNKNGWKLDRISGSHHIMVKKNFRSIPIPIHGNKDLPNKLVKIILKQANIKLE